MRAKSYAKINLALEIIDKRRDGYHEIKTILQAIDVHDDLWFSPSGGLSVTCSQPELENPGNLVWKAARLLQEQMDIAQGARIHLDKRIPISSGLGGGSSNAAATLVCLNEMWCLGLERSALAEMGALIGSDVPYFVYGGTALGINKGELISQLPSIDRQWLIVVNSATSIAAKTQHLYSKIGPRSYTTGQSVLSLAKTISLHKSLREDYMVNAFESVVDQVFPEIAWHRQLMLEHGLNNVHLSGAGPAMFAFVDNPEIGLLAEKALRGDGVSAILCSTVDHGCEQV